MPGCSALGCTNYYYAKNQFQNKLKAITFHRFPKEPNLRSKWICAVKRKNWQPSAGSCLCSGHFTEADFDRSSLRYVRLKEGVVPSVFPAIPPSPRLPKDPEQNVKSQVIKAIGQPEWKPSACAVLCTKHFPKANMDRTSQPEDVPSVFNKADVPPPNNGPSYDSKFGGPGSSKRPGSNLEDGRKKQKKILTEEVKTAEDERTEREITEELTEDPFQEIEIEEPVIKKEMFKHEEATIIERNIEDILAAGSSTRDTRHFETVFCSQNTIKVEPPDYAEASTSSGATETDTIDPELLDTVIKREHSEEPDSLQQFSGELETHQSLSLNHTVKDPLSKSKNVLLPISGSVAKCAASGLMSSSLVATSANLPVPFSSSGPITVTTTISYSSLTVTPSTLPALSPIVCSLSSSITPSTLPALSPIVSSVSSSRTPSTLPALSPIVSSLSSSIKRNPSDSTCISSTSSSIVKAPSGPNVHVSASTSPGGNDSSESFPSSSLFSDGADPLNPTDIPLVTSVSTYPSGSNPCPPAPLHVALLTKQDVSSSSCVGITKTNILKSHSLSPVPLPTTSTQPRLTKPNKTPSSTGSLESSSVGAKQSSSILNSVKTHKAQPIMIFNPPNFLHEGLPLCATDASETFLISLACFPQKKRVAIKKKMINVIDCISQKKVDPEDILIAFFEHKCHSRTM